MSLRSWIRLLLVEPPKRPGDRRRWAPWRLLYWSLRQKAADHAENRRWRVCSPLIVAVSEPNRKPHAYSYFLDWLAHERPSLRAHVYLDRLPSRLPKGAALLHAWVQDPVAERSPRVHAWLSGLEAECSHRGVGVVHPAGVLSNSKRDVLCERLGRAGIRTPRIAVVDEAFSTHRGGLSLPMVVRRRWGHGHSMRRLDTEASFDTWWAEARGYPDSWVAGEFVDARSEDGWYRKFRYFMAGSRGSSRHLIVSPNWEVRPTDRVTTPATRQEELAFVNEPCPHHGLFDTACRALSFEIAAFDYSYDTQGELVVWEVNPYPDLSRPKGDVGNYLAASVSRSYAVLADFYAERAGIEGMQR